MPGDDRVYIGHMLDVARKIAAKGDGSAQHENGRDENLRFALIHLVHTIGEAA